MGPLSAAVPSSTRERTQSYPVNSTTEFKPIIAQNLHSKPLNVKADTNELLESIGDKWESKRKALFTRARQELEAKRKARLTESVH